MKKVLLFLLVGVMSYIISFITLAPLNIIWSYLPKSETLKVGAIEGLLWKGEAYNIQTPNNPPIQALKWTLQPELLLQGQIAFNWSTQVLGGSAQGVCGINWRTHVQCQTAEFEMPANVVKQLAPDYAFILPDLAGNIRGNAFDLTWTREGLPHFTGQVSWDDPQTLTGMPLQLGKAFKIALTSDAEGIKGFGTSDKAQIDITGSQAALEPSGHYKIETLIRTTPDTHPNLKNGLDMMLGQPQADGTYRPVLEGDVVLPPLLQNTPN